MLSLKNIYLYDYQQGIEVPVLDWLSKAEWVNGHNTSVEIKEDGRVYIFIRRDYGFDFSLNNSLKDIQLNGNYEENLTAVILPEKGEMVNSVTFEPLPNMWIPVYQTDETILPDVTQMVRLFFMDTTENILIDYCLDVIAYGTTLQSSPDGRFLAISLYDSKIHQEQIIVLDLQTGNYALLNGYIALGWRDRQ